MLARNEGGSALLLTLIALSLLSLLGLYISLNASTGVQISDNYETQVQATYAALAGLNHARALVRGLAFDDLLKGPDGAYSANLSDLAQARTFEFRNPLSLITAHSLNILDPTPDVSGISDDGLMNTGFYSGSSGTVLIPATGIALSSANPYGSGELVTSRYFVKVTDNNGESSEMSGDPGDNPFADGDGIVIVRSMGISKTFSGFAGMIPRLNSVAVFEARFKRLFAFLPGPAVVVIGTQVSASFGGSYEIAGNLSPGIGTIDTDILDDSYPDQVIRAAAGEYANITGAGRPVPSIEDISAGIRADRDRSLLLNPRFLWNFVHSQASQIADTFLEGDQWWSEGSAPYAGSFDTAKSWNAPGQDPRITVINGSLNVTGTFSGGGLLVVSGNLNYSGLFAFNGLVLVVGSGNLIADGSGQGIVGGLLVAGLIDQGGEIVFGTPGISIGGASRFVENRDAVKMAIGLLPASQISFREIAGSDP